MEIFPCGLSELIIPSFLSVNVFFVFISFSVSSSLPITLLSPGQFPLITLRSVLFPFLIHIIPLSPEFIHYHFNTARSEDFSATGRAGTEDFIAPGITGSEDSIFDPGIIGSSQTTAISLPVQQDDAGSNHYSDEDETRRQEICRSHGNERNDLYPLMTTSSYSFNRSHDNISGGSDHMGGSSPGNLSPAGSFTILCSCNYCPDITLSMSHFIHEENSTVSIASGEMTDKYMFFDRYEMFYMFMLWILNDRCGDAIIDCMLVSRPLPTTFPGSSNWSVFLLAQLYLSTATISMVWDPAFVFSFSGGSFVLGEFFSGWRVFLAPTRSKTKRHSYIISVSVTVLYSFLAVHCHDVGTVNRNDWVPVPGVTDCYFSSWLLLIAGVLALFMVVKYSNQLLFMEIDSYLCS